MPKPSTAKDLLKVLLKSTDFERLEYFLLTLDWDGGDIDDWIETAEQITGVKMR